MATGGKSMNICLVGLPKSGKTNIICSLIGNIHVKEDNDNHEISTTSYKEVSVVEKLVSDDGIEYNIYDLPSIDNINDPDKLKTESIIKDTIKKCDLVLWVSDYNTAFTTNHELAQYNNIFNYVDELDNILMTILVSKVNIPSPDDISNTKLVDISSGDNSNDCEFGQCSITDDTSSDIDSFDDCDMLKKVQERIKTLNTHYPVMYFNAFGRNQYHKNSSSSLKTFVKRFNLYNTNIEFNLREYYGHIAPDDPVVTEFKKIHNFVNVDFVEFLKSSMNDETFVYDEEKFKHIGKLFSELYNSCEYEENKEKMMNFILYQRASYYINNIEYLLGLNINTSYQILNSSKTYYFWIENILDTLCKFINICVNFDIFTKYKQLQPSSNQTFRLLQFSKNIDKYHKIRLYSHFIYSQPCEVKIKLLNNTNTTYVFQPIYNLDCFTDDEFTRINGFDNYKYTRELYSITNMKKIRAIRKKIFGNIENDITDASILAAYDEYGLFWEPPEHI